MGKSLGSFGTKKEARDDWFDYFGEQIRIAPNLTDLRLLDFMRQASQMELPEPESDDFMPALAKLMPFVQEQLTFAIHPDDVDRFFKLAIDNGQGVQDLMEVMHGVLAAVTGRPTGRQSGSSAGRPLTKRSSTASSSSRVKRRLEQEGRPDLALMVLEADEARAARRSA